MALTKVTGQVINSTTDLSVGVATVGGGTSTGDLYVVGVATFSGDISIGGTLTYEDVTNVDSVGLITARKGITVTANGLYVNAGIATFNAGVKVGSGITLSTDGDVYTTGITTIATKLGIGSVHLGGTATDALLTIKGDTNAVATPSIRLLDGADAREVSISNTSGDFVASVHGADNTPHGHLKVFESGIISFSNGGASGSNTERLRIAVDGKVGINTNAGVAKLTVDASSGYSIIANGNSNAIALGSNGIILFGNKNAQAYGSGGYDATEHIFKTSGTERARIDSSGRLLIGSTASNQVWGLQGALQIEGTSASTATAALISNQNSNAPFYLAFAKSRGTSDGSATVVQDGDFLGTISFSAADGTDRENTSGRIDCVVDGSPGSNDTPGRLMFSTTPDGSGTVSERMRIDSKGRVLIGCTSSSYAYSQLVVEGNATFDGGTGGLQLQGGFTNPTGQGSGLGEIRFTDANEACGAVIKAESDAAWSNGSSYPSYLTFKTTAASATSSTERLRISSTGLMTQTGQTRISQSSTFSHALNAGTVLEIRGDAIGSGVVDVDFFKGLKIALNDSAEWGGQAQFSVGRWQDNGNNARSSLMVSLSNGQINSSSDADKDIFMCRSDGYFLVTSDWSAGYQANGVSLRSNGDSTFVVDGGAAVTFTRKSNDGKVIDFYNGTTYAGGIYVNGATSTALQQGSDYRLKDNVNTMTDGITKIKQLNPIYFTNKQIGGVLDTTTTQTGFLAHEVQTVIPTLVDGEKDGTIDEDGKGYQTLNYAGFSPTVVAAMKELIAKVETLEAEVAALKSS